MKKLSALLLALCLLIGVFVGCGGTASTPEASAPAAASEQETPDVQEEALEVEEPEPKDEANVIPVRAVPFSGAALPPVIPEMGHITYVL